MPSSIHYLDHAATTPMVPAAIEAMAEHLREVGNPSSLHASGRNARRVVEESRETIAQALNCRPGEVVFTSGGTEADNLALKGIHWSRVRGPGSGTPADHVRPWSTTRCSTRSSGSQDSGDAEVRYVRVDASCRIDLDELRALVVRAAGVADLGDVGQQRGRHRAADRGHRRHRGRARHPGAHRRGPGRRHGPGRLRGLRGRRAHPDRAQARRARTASAHWSCAASSTVTPLIHGGGQERDIRSGTIDTPAIAGFAAAVELAVKHQAEHATRVAALRDDLVRRVVEVVPDAHLHGGTMAPVGVHRLPGNAHLGFPGCEGDSLLMLLDARGIETSTGSACSAGVPQPSHVLLAMGCTPEDARHSLRFSLGHTSTQADVDAVVDAIGPVVERARAAEVPVMT